MEVLEVVAPPVLSQVAVAAATWAVPVAAGAAWAASAAVAPCVGAVVVAVAVAGAGRAFAALVEIVPGAWFVTAEGV